MTQKTRPYNCQVAPGQQPFQSGRPTATTHSKVPIAEATAGKLYRVRDKDWAELWGENLTHEQATKLKEQVVGSRRSKTARVEDMAVPPPDWWVQTHGGQQGSLGAASETESAEVSAPAATKTAYIIDGPAPVAIPGHGVVTQIPAGHELVIVQGSEPGVRALPCLVSKGDLVQARPTDPQIAAARAAALQAVQDTIHAQSQATKKRYRDTTVKAPAPRKGPPPKDRTAATGPVFVRLGAPPSSPSPNKADLLPSVLGAAIQSDGSEADGDLTDGDLKNLVPDLGGAPTADDIALAQRQREFDARNRSA